MTNTPAPANDTATYVIPVFKAKPGHADELEQLLAVLQTASRRDDGCIDYTVIIDEQDRNTFLLYEKWTDADAMVLHNEKQHVVDFLASAAEHMAEPLNVHRLRPIA